ncbi:MAG: dihydroneopterin aldolase [Marinagarivorans sp.]|nr:dihydroneopterin aldolase [Marinagarivorans sp.]
MDKVFIKHLKTEGVIGVFDWEREVRQPLYIDITMATDIAQAAASDDLAHTLDYKTICDFIQQRVAGSHFKLIETLAETLAQELRQEFAIRWLELSVHKPSAIAAAGDIGITIQRGELP